MNGADQSPGAQSAQQARTSTDGSGNVLAQREPADEAPTASGLTTTFAGPGGETHHLYVVGEGAEAQLVVASTPVVVRKFLEDLRPSYILATLMVTPTGLTAGFQQFIDAWKAADVWLNSWSSWNAKPATAFLGGAVEKQSWLGQAQLKLGEHLNVLYHWTGSFTRGAQADPFQINWLKPRVANYPVLRYGPQMKTEQSLPQVVLRLAEHIASAHDRAEFVISRGELDRNHAYVKNWIALGAPILQIPPTNQTQLPWRPEAIGVHGNYQVDVGFQWQLGQPTTTNSTNLLWNPLKSIGLHGTTENLDVDHVVEKQLGGPDALGNMWPLRAGANQANGTYLDTMVLDTGTQLFGQPLKLSLAALHLLAENGRAVWLRVAQIVNID